MKVIAACIVSTFGLWSSIASAQEHSGSLQDQLACTPDVYRLCGQFIPNEDTIVTCLKANKAKLSAACNEVFSRPDMMAPKTPGSNNEDD